MTPYVDRRNTWSNTWFARYLLAPGQLHCSQCSSARSSCSSFQKGRLPMRVCPNCRYKNTDTDDFCLNCDRVLPLTAPFRGAAGRDRAGGANPRTARMEDLARAPLPDNELPRMHRAAEPASPAPSTDACLRGASVGLGILSSAVSVLFLVLVIASKAAINSANGAEASSAGMAEGLGFLFFWLPFGALSAVLSLVCGLHVRSNRGLVGCLISVALALGLLVVAIALVTSL